MPLSQTYRNVLLAAAIILLPASPSRASAIIIGSDDSMNAMPFDDVTSGTYQQIYASSDFGSNPLSIASITFFGQPLSSVTSATYTVDLSTTTAALGSFTLYTPGPNNTQEFSGLLGGPITGSELTIPFSQVFNYNPASGNLLLQITISGGPQNPGGLGFDTQSNGGALFSRAYNVFDGTINLNSGDPTGLVTQFNPPAAPPAPEPGTLFLLGSALIGGVIAMRRWKPVAMLRSIPN